MTNKILLYLDRLSRKTIFILSLMFIFLIGIFDHLIGHDISTTLFYFMPIMITTWYVDKNSGIVISIFAAIIWLITDLTTVSVRIHPAILIWNSMMRLGIFLLITKLTSSFRDLLQNEKVAADTDNLTGVLNSRGFREHFQKEYIRCVRYKRLFSLAYIDVDNFKYINDKFGHIVGDKLLQTIANVFENNLRKSDVFARLGGDEFAILFPETSSDVISRAFSHSYEQVNLAMAKNEWPVTFSIGIVSFESMPDSIDHALAVADKVMYGVKKNMKNSVTYTTWKNPSHTF